MQWAILPGGPAILGFLPSRRGPGIAAQFAYPLPIMTAAAFEDPGGMGSTIAITDRAGPVILADTAVIDPAVALIPGHRRRIPVSADVAGPGCGRQTNQSQNNDQKSKVPGNSNHRLHLPCR